MELISPTGWINDGHVFAITVDLGLHQGLHPPVPMGSAPKPAATFVGFAKILPSILGTVVQPNVIINLAGPLTSSLLFLVSKKLCLRQIASI